MKPGSIIAIMYRQESPEALAKAQEVARWLKEKGFSPVTTRNQDLSECGRIDSLDAADLVVTLGGDGTYLEAVRLLDGAKVPILGVNMGSLGFLTVCPSDDVFELLEKALKGQLDSRPRSLIQAEVNGETPNTFVALNDIVFERGSMSQLLFLRIKSGEQQINDLKADGLIFSTPTGSTAYNLSAGGPILHPEVKAFIMTPICPHSLTNRPTVFPDDIALTVEVLNPEQSAGLTIDGHTRMAIKPGQTVTIKKSSHQHFVLRKQGHNYFATLRKKLKFGQRA